MEDNMVTFNTEATDFEIMINSAVRYALGRQTYVPGSVIGFLRPLLTKLSTKTLYVIDQDISDAKHQCEQGLMALGDPRIDAPMWIAFHYEVREELTKRGEKTYVGYWEGEKK